MKNFFTYLFSEEIEDPTTTIWLLILLFSALFSPASALAAISTDFPTYAAPATILYSGFSGGPDLDVYDDNAPSDPVCSIASPATSGDLAVQCTAHASAPNNTFDANHPSSYTLIQASNAHCGTSQSGSATTLSACLALNPSSSDHATFTITGSSPPTPPLGGATSTVDQAEENLYLAVFVFFASMLTMIWLMRKH